MPRILPAKRPRFSSHGGRTWDAIQVVLPGGDLVDGWVDTTWGHYVYFQIGPTWRRVAVEEITGEYGMLILNEEAPDA